MIKILMNGCNGKMGQAITRLCPEYPDLQIAAGIDIQPDKYVNAYPVYGSFDEVREEIDVVIDFSHAAALPLTIKYCMDTGAALVVATTGLSGDDHTALTGASEHIAVFQSANMSLGINVIMSLAAQGAVRLKDSFDIEILEKHHNEKKDAPSGTALMLAEEINSSLGNSMEFIYDRSQLTEARNTNEIGISSIRGGTIPGEHTVIFAGPDEIIEIKHTALSRDIFARGALRAANYIASKEKGMYNMKIMLEEMSR